MQAVKRYGFVDAVCAAASFGEILRRLVLRGVERLKNLFSGNKSRSEIVATFLAVLDLCRSRCLSLVDTEQDMTVQFEKLPDEEKNSEFDET